MNFALLASLAIGTIIFLAAAFIAEYSNDFLVIALSFLIVIPPALIAVLKEVRDIFSPLKIYTYVLIVSSPLFSVYVYYFADSWKYDYALFWQSFHELTPGIVLISFATISMIIGYLVTGSNAFKPKPSLVSAYYSRVKLRLAAYSVLLISMVAGLMFALDVNYAATLADNVMARKSIHEASVGVSVRGSALTHWRFLGVNLPHAMIIVFFTLVWLKKVRSSQHDLILLGVIFLVSCFIPFIASSRTPILEILVVLVMIRHYLVRRVAMHKLLLVGFLFMMVIGTLGELRRNPDNFNFASVTNSVDSIVASQYFVDLGKTSVVVNRVPSQVDYLYGSSLATIAFAFVPRQIWPDKPIVRIGYFVGQNIIKLNNQTGIPPGFIAEIYLNFGYWGIFPVFFLLGMLIARLYNGVRREANYVTTVAYVVSIVTVTLSLLATDLTYALLQALFYFVPIAVITRVVRR